MSAVQVLTRAHQVSATAGVLLMSNCSVQCRSCVGEALAVSGDAHVAAAHCLFHASKSEGHDYEVVGGDVAVGILSQYSPVLAEKCTFTSSAGALEGARLQGSSHVFASCDWHCCAVGAVLTDEACARLLGCSASLCSAGLHVTSKSQVDADKCVLLQNNSAIVLEEGAYARVSSSHFVKNQVAAAARSASLHLRSTCCVFAAAALILDKRAAATLEDCAFFGDAASDDDVNWLHGDSVQLSAAATSNATECLALARQQQQQQQQQQNGDGGSPALRIVCTVKSVSSATW
jgi:hypothetical protein